MTPLFYTDQTGQPILGIKPIPYTGKTNSQVPAPTVPGYTPVAPQVTIPATGGDLKPGIHAKI